MNKRLKKSLKALLPIVLGIFVLYFVYCDYDFSRIGEVLAHEVAWDWMALSLLFGILSHVFRGLRWEQTLQPLGEHPTCVGSRPFSLWVSILKKPTV